jgi:hypothetical protein
MRMLADGLAIQETVLPFLQSRLEHGIAARRGSARRAVVHLTAGVGPKNLGTLLAAASKAGIDVIRIEATGFDLEAVISRRAETESVDEETGTSRVVLGWNQNERMLAQPVSRSDPKRISWIAGDAADERRAVAALTEICRTSGCDTRFAAGRGSSDGTSLAHLSSLSRIQAAVPSLGLHLIYTDVSVSGDASSGFVPPWLIDHGVKEDADGIVACCEPPTPAAPAARGTFRLAFTLGVDGKLSDVRDVGSDGTLASANKCVLARFQAMTLAEPVDGPVKVVLSLPILSNHETSP